MNSGHPRACLEVDLHVVLDDFTLEASFSASQELLVLFGPSGAGKSTILKALAGLLTPDRGTIRLNDRVLYDSRSKVNLPPQKRRIGYMPQQYGLFPHLTIAENIAYGLPPAPKSKRNAQVEKWIEVMRLTDQADRKPSEASGGQQQRAALARAMASGPELLLMDEPFAALDEELRAHLRGEIRDLSNTFDLPILIVTHDTSEAYSLADHMVVFERGVMIQDGPREDVFRKPVSESLARLLGMSNVYDADVLTSEIGKTTISWLGNIIELPMNRLVEGTSVRIGIRPGEIEIPQQISTEPDAVILPGRLVEMIPTGFDLLLRFEVQDSAGSTFMEVRVSQAGMMNARLQIGGIYQLQLNNTSIHVFSDPRELD
jgi:molybdate transport system ATP-binding protein